VCRRSSTNICANGQFSQARRPPPQIRRSGRRRRDLDEADPWSSNERRRYHCVNIQYNVSPTWFLVYWISVFSRSSRPRWASPSGAHPASAFGVPWKVNQDSSCSTMDMAQSCYIGIPLVPAVPAIASRRVFSAGCQSSGLPVSELIIDPQLHPKLNSFFFSPPLTSLALTYCTTPTTGFVELHGHEGPLEHG
jgi:hypothetical protein